MANLDNKSGFTPVARFDGSKIPTRRFRVIVTNTAMFVGDMVLAGAGGAINVAKEGEGDLVLGAVIGLYDTSEVPVGSHESSVSTKYLTAAAGGYADVALALPDSVFRVQVSSATTPTSADIFAASDHFQTLGNTVTAVSAQTLTGTFSTGEQFKVIDKSAEPNNSWGSAVDVLVVASESYWSAGTDGV